MTPEEFRIALIRLRLRQFEFGEQMGANPVMVSRWANGHRPIPEDVVAAIQQMLADRRAAGEVA